MAYRIVVVLALVGLAGCQNQFDTNSQRAPILGGTIPDVSGFPSVGAMEIVLPPDPDDPKKVRDNLWCGATLIAPTIALTAASCVEENLTAGTVSDIDLRFGDDFGSGVAVNITEVVLHRYYNPEQTVRNNVAMLLLDADPGVVPAVLNERALTQSDVGVEATLVGHGETEVGAGDFGQRNKVQVTLDVVGVDHIQAGTDELSACLGDSGAPVFADLGAGPVVIAINTSLGSCFANAQRTRVDRYTARFIYPFVDRHFGACIANGVCDTAGCRSPDPDCDTCSWQGTQPPPETPGADCQLDCPTRDWDCPIGIYVGGTCAIDGDCEELGSCIAASDDASYSYCTRSCDPAGPAGQCASEVVGATMTCVDVGGGVGECTYDEPSPGSQGFECGVDNTRCRSGICEETICVNECDPGGATCADGFTCGPSTVSPGTNVCLGAIKSGGGGFCAIGPVGAKKQAIAPTLFGLLLLGGVMFGLVWLTRRRRR